MLFERIKSALTSRSKRLRPVAQGAFDFQGKIAIKKEGSLRARLNGQVTAYARLRIEEDGHVEGPLTCHGRLECASGGTVNGPSRCESLILEEGARLTGPLTVRPREGKSRGGH